MAASKFWTKKRIVILTLILIVLVTAIVLGVVFGLKSGEVKTAEESVARGSLSSNISSSGTVVEAGITRDIPFYAAVNDITDLSDIKDYDSNFSWTDFLVNAIINDVPLYYKVTYANSAMCGKRNVLNTKSDNITVFRVSPLYIDFEALKSDYDRLVAEGVISRDTTLSDFILDVFLAPGGSDSGLPDDLNDYLILDESEAAVREIDTDYVKSLIEEATSPEESGAIEYTLYNFNLTVGTYIGMDSTVFRVSVTQLYTSFTVTEYDVASIDKMLRESAASEAETGVKQGVYAAVTINALNGRKVLAEIQEILTGSYSSGVAYYAVKAKIVFGEPKVVDLTSPADEDAEMAAAYLAENPGAEEMRYLDYTYYDESLDVETVEGLGIDVNDILTREEVLVGYSVAVRVPQEVVYNSLIVPTKCIFYDSESKPYVTVRESGRDKRVYVRILLSTGTEAAVEANSGYELNEGDKVVYRADDSLISSILG